MYVINVGFYVYELKYYHNCCLYLIEFKNAGVELV